MGKNHIHGTAGHYSCHILCPVSVYEWQITLKRNVVRVM